MSKFQTALCAPPIAQQQRRQSFGGVLMAKPLRAHPQLVMLSVLSPRNAVVPLPPQTAEEG
jgi:hypothetical protein